MKRDDRSHGELASRAGGGRALVAPRPVTRGESPRGGQTVKVDWINATFPAPDVSADEFVRAVGALLGRPVFAVQGRGLIGFKESMTLHAKHGSASSPIGTVAWGGEAQRGRWLLQLTGTGCQLVRDWGRLRQLLERIGAKLTRVDLALDFLEGEKTIEDAVEVYQRGGFQLGGRPPQTSVSGDYIGLKKGRTLYIGSARNGKMLRVYEKGKQLGDEGSDWTRFEVQLGSRDRVIPFDVLTERDAYFAGCYPALADLVQEAAMAIPTLQKGGEVTVAHLLYHLKRCYGKLLDTCLSQVCVQDADLLRELRVMGLPRRVPVSSVAAGVEWSDVLDQVKRKVR